jgi:hypothetical protein
MPASRDPRFGAARLGLTMFVLLAAAGMLSTVPAYAHHSFAATYFEDKTQTIEGDLVQFLFRNPHSFVHVEAKDEKGELQRWAIVMKWIQRSQLESAWREPMVPARRRA